MNTERLPPVVWLLFVTQALSMSATPLFFLTGGIIGNDIGPRPSLATLPIAMIILGMALAAVPSTRLMQRRGRKRIFIVGAAIGIVAALLAAAALYYQLFSVFCGAALMTGISAVIAHQYRFAAIESVGPALTSRAASRVLLGGLLSAFVGPELIIWGRLPENLLNIPSAHLNHGAFIGGFLLLALVLLVVLLILALWYRDGNTEFDTERVEGRSLKKIFANPLLWLAVVASAMGYAMMSFVMTATPLNMHTVHGHGIVDTKWVVQSHIIAMFAPAFITGWLIARLGHWRVIGLGVLTYVACLAVALAGHHLLHYWWSMVLLGLGWNFMFLAGTSLLPQCYRDSERFKVQSINEFGVFGSQAVAALSAGWIVSRFGWDTMVSVSAVMVACVVIAMWFNRTQPEPRALSSR